MYVADNLVDSQHPYNLKIVYGNHKNSFSVSQWWMQEYLFAFWEICLHFCDGEKKKREVFLFPSGDFEEIVSESTVDKL